MRKFVTDVKVIPDEEVAQQHQLLVRDMRFDVPPKPKHKFKPRLKIWKLTDPQEKSLLGGFQLACECVSRCT